MLAGGTEAMGRWITTLTTLAVLAVMPLAAGCSSKDSEGLTNVCRKVKDRTDNLTGGANSKLATGFRALRGSASNSAIGCRVAVRLRWEQSLADADIRVTTTGPGVVKLEGTISDQAQRSRAIDVAKGTQGVTDVQDAMEIKAATPSP
jgi:hyperosmotically inducible periplasmic protein